ncbi:hypothetical protein GQ600_25782 [Phytophthora cactorum]|nr:hypothetical protein GQ600_25782 [Phytophthora cactorum]
MSRLVTCWFTNQRLFDSRLLPSTSTRLRLDFIPLVATHLSDDVLTKVPTRLDYFMGFLAKDNLFNDDLMWVNEKKYTRICVPAQRLRVDLFVSILPHVPSTMSAPNTYRFSQTSI